MELIREKPPEVNAMQKRKILFLLALVDVDMGFCKFGRLYPSPIIVRWFNLPSVDLLHCNSEDMPICNVSYQFSREMVGGFMKFVFV